MTLAPASMKRWRGVEAQINRLAAWYNAINGTEHALGGYKAAPMLPAKPFDLVHPRLRAAQQRLDAMCGKFEVAFDSPPQAFWNFAALSTRARAYTGQMIWVYDESEPPELVQIEAEGGEMYFDEFGNPAYITGEQAMLYPLYLERRNEIAGLEVTEPERGTAEEEPFCQFDTALRSWERRTVLDAPPKIGRVTHHIDTNYDAPSPLRYVGDIHGPWIWREIEAALGISWNEADQVHEATEAGSPYRVMIPTPSFIPPGSGELSFNEMYGVVPTISFQFRAGSGESGQYDPDMDPWPTAAEAIAAAEADFEWEAWEPGYVLPAYRRSVTFWAEGSFSAAEEAVEVRVKISFALPAGENEPGLSFIMALTSATGHVFDAPAYDQFNPLAVPPDIDPIFAVPMTRGSWCTLPLPEPAWPADVGEYTAWELLVLGFGEDFLSGTYSSSGAVNGRPRYTRPAMSGISPIPPYDPYDWEQADIYYDGEDWVIEYDGVVYYYSSEDVFEPFDVTTWTADAGSDHGGSVDQQFIGDRKTGEIRGWQTYQGGFDFSSYDGETAPKSFELPHLRVELQEE